MALSLNAPLFKGALKRFLEEDALTHAAALSYFTVFSLPPMLLIILWSAGLFYEEASVSAAISSELSALIARMVAKDPAERYTEPADVAAALTSLLTGSEVVANHRDCARVQDPYSVRCSPQVIGASLGTVRRAREVLLCEAGSVTDNPVLLPDKLFRHLSETDR